MAIESVTTGTGSTARAENPSKSKDPQQLSEDEKRAVDKLRSRDREVRAHEAAHVAAGGQYVRGGASFEYQKGPDGQNYAVGGEVSIDTSPVRGDPRATIMKMQMVQRAALAPANPSGQDRAVAGRASAMAAQAQQDLVSQKTDASAGKEPSTPNGYSKKAEKNHPPQGVSMVDLIA